VLEAALEIAAERRRRVPTSALNAMLREATFRQQPPLVRGKRPSIYYAAQVSIEPPTFVFFAGGAADIHFSYKRYLENRLREAFGFAGTPIRLIFRERSREQARHEPLRRGKPRPDKRPRAARQRAG
jgi:GTP-binding protein